MTTMKDILNRMLNHEELTRKETHDILLGITKSEFPNEQITALLTALQMRGVTVDELLGFRDGILETGVPAILNCDRYIDVVGTGGDRKNTFNISTTSCFVIAGAGYKVAKHGNYAATSTSGASNVIAHHGVKFTSDIDQLNRCMDVANLDQMRLYKNVYEKIGIDYCIVNSIDGYDEISLTGDFKISSNTLEKVFSPEELGLHIAKPEELVAGASEEEAAAIFDSVLENRCLPAQKEIVIANAAFGIMTLEKGKKDIFECMEIAKDSIESGKALNTFKKFVKYNS